MTEHLTDLDAAVDWLFARVDGPLRIGAPLALGKPHRLLNALYASSTIRRDRCSCIPRCR